MKRWHRRGLDAEFPARQRRASWLANYEKQFPPGAIAALDDGRAAGIVRMLDPESDNSLNALKKAAAARPGDGRALVEEIEKQVREVWQGNYPTHLSALFNRIQDPSQDDKEEIDRQIRTIPGVHFAMAVYLPAYVLCQRTPHQLLLEARGGSDEAIESLIRIDPQFTSSDEVDQWVNDNSGKTRLARQRNVSQWATEGLIGRFGRTGFLSSMAALVSSMSKRVNFVLTSKGFVASQLTSTAIKEVFDGAVSDAHAISPNWYGRTRSALSADENLTKAIRRKRERWDQLFEKMHGQKLEEVLSA